MMIRKQIGYFFLGLIPISLIAVSAWVFTVFENLWAIFCFALLVVAFLALIWSFGQLTAHVWEEIQDQIHIRKNR